MARAESFRPRFFAGKARIVLRGGGISGKCSAVKRIVMSIGLWAAFVSVVWGNAGGYARGGVSSAGAVQGFEPKETEKVRIMDESLHVSLGQKAAEVEVRYVMRNISDGGAKVRFGFPVEEGVDQDPYHFDSDKEKGGAEKKSALKYCTGYHIEVGGKETEAKFEEEKDKAKNFKGVAGWLVSEMKFGKGEERTVDIRFTSEYPYKTNFISEDYCTASRLFVYRLSTAACWAGTIRHGTITLVPSGIDPSEVSILKPANRFHKEGDHWVWNFEELEPTRADDLEIEAVPEEIGDSRYPGGGTEGKGRMVCYVQRGKRWEMEHSNYRVTASSTLAPQGENKYGADNLKDGEGVWSEGAPGSGTGEWLEIRPDVPQPLRAITILPGYPKDKALYLANARPKTVRIELNGEHRFDATIPDRMEECRIPVAGYDKAVSKIKITFTSVYEGARYQDMCVARVALSAALAKKPKIGPSR
jgi:hypothetical protein